MSRVLSGVTVMFRTVRIPVQVPPSIRGARRRPMRLAPAYLLVTRCLRPARPLRAMSAAMAVLAVTALAAGCQAGSGSGTSAAARAAITVAAIPGVDDAPLYLAAKNGAFRAAGLDVTIRRYQSVSKELQALQSGHVDVAARSEEHTSELQSLRH